jgi:hypothetical protein
MKLLGYPFLYLSEFFGVTGELQLLGSLLDKFTSQKNPEKFSRLKQQGGETISGNYSASENKKNQKSAPAIERT